jgi:hypothetical protein
MAVSRLPPLAALLFASAVAGAPAAAAINAAPTGLTRKADGGAFIGDTVSGRGRIIITVPRGSPAGGGAQMSIEVAAP